MILQAGAITVANNEHGPLDLAMADPTTENRSQYHVGGVQWGGVFTYGRYAMGYNIDCWMGGLIGQWMGRPLYRVGEGEGVWSLHLCAIAISDKGLRYMILIWIAIKGNICGNA